MNKRILKDKKIFILDMDGTFYLGDRLLEGSLRFLDEVKAKGKDFLFFTNNSSKNSSVYVDKLADMGCFVSEDQVLTSGMVTAHYLKKRWDNPKVYLLGTPMLEDDFIKRGIILTDDKPDAVVVGFDTTLTYEKLSRACTLIYSGIPFIATHPDNNCPMEEGFIPDCGAICSFITRSTGVTPKYLGKPHTETLEYITDHLKINKSKLVFVGDRLYTDIAIGANHGVTSALVLTGESKLKDIHSSSVKPDIIVDRLIDLAEYF